MNNRLFKKKNLPSDIAASFASARPVEALLAGLYTTTHRGSTLLADVALESLATAHFASDIHKPFHWKFKKKGGGAKSDEKYTSAILFIGDLSKICR